MWSKNNHIMWTECSIDMKQTALGKKKKKKKDFISFYHVSKSNFDLCPVLPGFAIMPHISPLLARTRGIMRLESSLVKAVYNWLNLPFWVVLVKLRSREKVYFKSLLLEYKHRAKLEHICVPVLLATGQDCNVLDPLIKKTSALMNRPKEDFPVWSITPTHLYLCDNIPQLGDTCTLWMFQYCPILEHSSIWDLIYKYWLFWGAQLKL